MSGKEKRECLEALLVFFVPLAFAVPLYMFGFLTEVSGNYVLYTIYIACSVLLTLRNGRSLAEIGVTRKGLVPSLGNSVAFVMAAFVTRFIGADLRLAPEATSWEAVAYNVFFWSLSGFGQEILFRGLILFTFDRWKGWKVGLLVSTILFGPVHLLAYPSVFGILLVSIAGLCWGWIALKTKNIVGTSIAHSLYNFLFSFLFVS